MNMNLHRHKKKKKASNKGDHAINLEQLEKVASAMQ